MSLNLSILNLEIGTGGSSSEDDADFIATVEFSNSAGLSYSFEKIKFDNYGFRNERVSVVMYKDENISNNIDETIRKGVGQRIDIADYAHEDLSVRTRVEIAKRQRLNVVEDVATNVGKHELTDFHNVNGSVA